MASHDLPLGRTVAYPTHYDPSLLFPIDRRGGRDAIGVPDVLPFIGHDRWHAYELSWLDPRGKPQVATATFHVPAASPRLIESKSLKLYLNSLNGSRFDGAGAVFATIARDLSATAGAQVAVEAGVPVPAMDTAPAGVVDLDAIGIACDAYDGPEPGLLHADDDDVADEILHSALLKSNCPVTGQPDWASVTIACRGPRIGRDGLLRYLVSFRDHAGFHEQCVERIFVDIMARCRPQALSVEARYTRRGGLDINPWRATPGMPVPVAGRDLRQ